MAQIKIKMTSRAGDLQFWTSLVFRLPQFGHNQHLLKMLQKNGKKDQNSSFCRMAGNGRFHKIFFKTCSLVSLVPLWWILDHYTIFMNFGSMSNFDKNLKKFQSYWFVGIFQKFFNCKSLRKSSKKIFFHVWNLVNCFS